MGAEDDIPMVPPNAEKKDVHVLVDENGVVISAERLDDALDVLEDMHDLQQAHTPERKTLWSRIGPGLITGAADDDPTDVAMYSISGAQFGTSLIWTALLGLPLMIAIQEMCARVALVTKHGLAAVIKAHYPRWLLWLCVGLLAVANVITVWADLNAMAASMQMVAGYSQTAWLWAVSLFVMGLIVWVPYRLYVVYLKWLALALLSYAVVDLIPRVGVHWGAMFGALVHPSFSTSAAYLTTLVGILGGDISPYLFFWQAGETVEEAVAERKAEQPGVPLKPATRDDVWWMRFDTALGMIVSQAVSFFIVVCSATVLNGHHNTIQTAQQAAAALLPLGHFAFTLFAVGIVGGGILAVSTLAGSTAYAIAEAANWSYGLYRRFRRARSFYLTMAAVVGIGLVLNFVRSLSAMTALEVAAVINGLAAPLLIVVLLLICNNRKIMGKRRNGWLSNTIGAGSALIMTAAVVYMLWAMATGQS